MFTGIIEEIGRIDFIKKGTQSAEGAGGNQDR